MTETDKLYYGKMLEKNRLFPFAVKEAHGLMGFITFYIGNDRNKYVQDNPWEVLDDEPGEGKTCFIAQLLTNKDKNNPKLAYKVWYRFKEYIKLNFPKVEEIYWHRWKNDRVYIYKKEMEKCLH